MKHWNCVNYQFKNQNVHGSFNKNKTEVKSEMLNIHIKNYCTIEWCYIILLDIILKSKDPVHRKHFSKKGTLCFSCFSAQSFLLFTKLLSLTPFPALSCSRETTSNCWDYFVQNLKSRQSLLWFFPSVKGQFVCVKGKIEDKGREEGKKQV